MVTRSDEVVVREKRGTHLYEVRELMQRTALILGGFEERKEDS